MRRLRVLVAALPPDTALGVALEAHRPGWGNAEELLAAIAELVDQGNRYFYAAHARRGAENPRPIKIERPGRRKRRRPATSEDLREFFGGAVRYTGPSHTADLEPRRPRCTRGHFVRDGEPCRRCQGEPLTLISDRLR